MKKAPPKILVVDDTEATRYAVARTLKSGGYDIVEAANGTEALSLVASEKPDLVTLDIHLPDILGFEVCRRIKLNPATAHVPVLQVSASYVTSKDRIHGLEGGADSYLTHPFEPPVLLATVKALLRGKQLNESLRLSEERFRVALKNAPIMIATCDRDLRYNWLYHPPAPLGTEDLLGRRDAEIFPPAEAAALTALKRETLETEEGRQKLMTLTLRGESHFFDLTVEPLRGADGTIDGLTLAFIDVTERVRAENEQRQATEEAEMANHAKSRFLSNMSHEIRTPLGVIQGFVDLALASDAAEDRRDYLQTIKRNAQSLTKLLGEILDLSKIEAGRIEIEMTRFPLPSLLDEVLSTLSLPAKEKGIVLRSEIVEPFPAHVTSDPTRLRQVLINLLSNAIKFTSRGGVSMIARLLPGGDDSANIEFLVSDTGIGLAPEQQSRLFQAFMQADSSTTRRFGGTGLGLSLSKKLAHALGGDLVLVHSEPDRGSTFRFTFDAGALRPEDFTERPPNVRGEVPAGPDFTGLLRGLKVLLVDDSVDNQVLFSEYLKRTGAHVDLAGDGVEGIELARRNLYDAILMDVQMPHLDGYDATATLRAEGFARPIIALTAHAMKEERTRALANGFDDYLIKPINPVLLIETLRRHRENA